jgi:hypothetical protein
MCAPTHAPLRSGQARPSTDEEAARPRTSTHHNKTPLRPKANQSRSLQLKQEVQGVWDTGCRVAGFGPDQG